MSTDLHPLHYLARVPMTESSRNHGNMPEIVTKHILTVSIMMTIFGCAMMFFGICINKEYEIWRDLVKSIGQTILGIGIFSTSWELFARRVFIREILEEVEVSKDVVDSGFQRACEVNGSKIAWDKLIEKSSCVDIFVWYASSWKTARRKSLINFASKPGNKMRVLLPNPDSSIIMKEIARRSGKDVGTIETKVREAYNDYSSLGSEVECRVIDESPLMSIFIFSESSVFTLYTHHHDRTFVPAIQVENEKFMHTFLKTEFDRLWEKAKALNHSKSSS